MVFVWYFWFLCVRKLGRLNYSLGKLASVFKWPPDLWGCALYLAPLFLSVTSQMSLCTHFANAAQFTTTFPHLFTPDRGVASLSCCSGVTSVGNSGTQSRCFVQLDNSFMFFAKMKSRCLFQESTCGEISPKFLHRRMLESLKLVEELRNVWIFPLCCGSTIFWLWVSILSVFPQADLFARFWIKSCLNLLKIFEFFSAMMCLSGSNSASFSEEFLQNCHLPHFFLELAYNCLWACNHVNLSF